jgi:V/A-type H+-transporting ATPase subunit E
MGKPPVKTTDLDLIIEKIRSEGIEAAESEAAEIRKKALAEASDIVAGAKKEADRMISDAEKSIMRKENTSRKALEFAARDSILMIRSYLENLIRKLVENECSSVIDKEFLKEMILKILDKWSESGEKMADGDIKIQVSDRDSRILRDILHSAISGRIASGLEIKPVPGLKAGFRISRSKDNFYHDFSDESIAEILSSFLSPDKKTLIDPERMDQEKTTDKNIDKKVNESEY